MVVEVRGDDPDGLCSAKQANNRLMKMVGTRIAERKTQLHALVHGESFLLQAPEITVNRLVFRLGKCDASDFLGQIEKIRVIRGGVHGHPCASEENELALLLRIDYRLRYVDLMYAHKKFV